jgi:predicted outer membrane repeat protein
LSEIKDTCIIADHDGDLIVYNVFFHKCARVVKLQSQSAGSTFTIRNSIIRINNGRNVRARGRLFNGRSIESKAQVYFEDNVVVTATGLDARSLSILAANCSDNTLIWIGKGDYPGDLPGCFTVVKGKKAWREVRLAWTGQHERQLAELGEHIDPGGSACAVPEVPVSPLPDKTVGRGSPTSCTESALRRALSGGGTVTFSCGPSPVIIPIGSELVVSSRTVLDGGGTVTLDGQDRTRIIRNDSQLTLKRITLTRGRKDVVWNGSPDGGGAVNTTYGNRLHVVDSTFTNNRTSAQGFGGAIFQAGAGALTVVRSRFESNVGGGGGAIYNLLAGLRVVDSAFVRNQGSSGWQGGGGIMTDGASANSGNGGSGGEILICGSSFNANQALATGGGAYLYAYRRDTVSVTHSTFTRNSVTANDGGLSMGGGLRLGASPALVTDTTFRNNTARTGGAIATNGARTRVEDSTFECNSSDIEGGVLAEGNAMLGC